MADTEEKTDGPVMKPKPDKPGRIKYVVDRKNFLAKLALVLMGMSVLFRLLGYWGFWNDPSSDATYTEVFLPIACCILFIVLIEMLGRAALWSTSLPVFMTAVFLILETFAVKVWWVKALSILLYVVAACVYTMTVFGKIRTKWLLVVTIGTPLVYHLAVQDRSSLYAATPTTLVQWMPEISAMCFLTALLFTTLAMGKIVPSVYDGRPDYIRMKGPKYVPPELEYRPSARNEAEKTDALAQTQILPKEEPPTGTPAATEPTEEKRLPQ
jgi:hypothetical protein